VRDGIRVGVLAAAQEVSPPPGSYELGQHKLLPLLSGVLLSHVKVVQRVGGISHCRSLRVGMPRVSMLLVPLVGILLSYGNGRLLKHLARCF